MQGDRLLDHGVWTVMTLQRAMSFEIMSEATEEAQHRHLGTWKSTTQQTIEKNVRQISAVKEAFCAESNWRKRVGADALLAVGLVFGAPLVWRLVRR